MNILTPDEMYARIKFLEDEVAGYQRIAKEAAETQDKTVVLMIHDGIEMRIYGPTPDREQAFAESIAHYFKLVGVVSDCLIVKKARESLSSISARLKEIEKVLTKGDPDIVAVAAEAKR